MESLVIERTKSTPAILFDAGNSKLQITGQSYPENAFKFYEPVLKWLDAYLEELEQQIVVELYFNMPYINTSSTKCIMMLMEKLEDAHRVGKSITIRWYYDLGNDTALECAEEFKEDLSLPFEITPVEAQD